MEHLTINNTHLSQQEYEQYWHGGMNYPSYYNSAEQQTESGETEGYAQYIPMNFQRMKRLGKTIHLTETMQQKLAALQQKVYWLVISEPWCGDASQIVPVLAAIANASEGKIELRIVLRDANLPLMDAHLTGTSRSIPKLIQLDQHFKVLAVWGPRPAAAQALVLEQKAAGADYTTLSENLHRWYAQDKQQAIQAEIGDLL